MSKKSKKLGMQVLEEKAMMAGDVAVSFENGLLEIEQGSTAGGADQQVMVSYLGNNKIRVFGLNDTTINGATPNYNSLSHSSYQDFEVPGLVDVEVDLGIGNDSFSFDGGAKGMSMQDLTINMGWEGRGNLTNDADYLSLHKLNVLGGLSIETGDSNDTVDLSYVNVGDGPGADNLEINTGRGADTVALWSTNSDHDTKINTTRDSWDNDVDKVFMRYGQTLGEVDIDTGDGDDLVDIYRGRIGRNLEIDTNGGADDVRISYTDVGMFGYGVLDVDMGAGSSDYLYVYRSSADAANLDGGGGAWDKLYARDNAFGDLDYANFEAAGVYV